MTVSTGAGRIIFVNRFFHPDHSATAQILADIAFSLAESGWEVSVITSQMRYDDPTAELAARERVNGVAVHRVATSRFGRGRVLGRTIDYLSFYVAAFCAALSLCRRGDVLVAKTDPPLLSVPLALVARLCRATFVNWLQDLYPEVATAMGFRALEGPAGRVAGALRNRSLRAARANVAIGALMAERLVREGVARERVMVIPNWSDDVAIQPIPMAEVALRREWGFGPDDFVLGYSGNLGRAHEVDTLVAAAIRLRERQDIKFLFVGGGHVLDALKDRVMRERLKNFSFQPYQPKSALAQSLAVPDVHWLSLLPEMEGLIVPSKAFGIAAAGRPILAIADPDGEIGRIVRRHGCGFAVRPGNAEGLAAVIASLAGDRVACGEMGTAARAMLDGGYKRQHAVDRWETLLRAIV